MMNRLKSIGDIILHDYGKVPYYAYRMLVGFGVFTIAVSTVLLIGRLITTGDLLWLFMNGVLGCIAGLILVAFVLLLDSLGRLFLE